MIFHENRLSADDSHERACLIVSFEKAANLKLSLLQIIGGALWVKRYFCYFLTKTNGSFELQKQMFKLI